VQHPPFDRPRFAELEQTPQPTLKALLHLMLGSPFDAEETPCRMASRGVARPRQFEGKCRRLRSWLYRIATNVCLDQPRGSELARETDGPLARPTEPLRRTELEGTTKLNDRADPRDHGRRPSRNPAIAPVASESIRLAFVAGASKLPAASAPCSSARGVLRVSRRLRFAELLDSSGRIGEQLVQRRARRWAKST